MLGQISQTQKDTYYDSTCLKYVEKKKKSYNWNLDRGYQELGGGGIRIID